MHTATLYSSFINLDSTGWEPIHWKRHFCRALSPSFLLHDSRPCTLHIHTISIWLQTSCTLVELNIYRCVWWDDSDFRRIMFHLHKQQLSYFVQPTTSRRFWVLCQPKQRHVRWPTQCLTKIMTHAVVAPNLQKMSTKPARPIQRNAGRGWRGRHAFKGTVHPKMKIESLSTPTHINGDEKTV